MAKAIESTIETIVWVWFIGLFVYGFGNHNFTRGLMWPYAVYLDISHSERPTQKDKHD